MGVARARRACPDLACRHVSRPDDDRRSWQQTTFFRRMTAQAPGESSRRRDFGQ